MYSYTGSADSNTVLKIMVTQASGHIGPNWVKATGNYLSTASTAVTFNFRLTRSGTVPTTRTYYVDDISFVAA